MKFEFHWNFLQKKGLINIYGNLMKYWKSVSQSEMMNVLKQGIKQNIASFIRLTIHSLSIVHLPPRPGIYVQ